MSALDYPVALRLERQPVLLVGAGAVALHRLQQLLEVGAVVRAVAPTVSQAILGLAADRRLVLEQRPYQEGDCAGARWVFVATDDRRVTQAVVDEARRRGIPVNAADATDLCDFTIPSIGRRGPVTVSVSTSGRAPALARALRLRLMAGLGPEVGELARLVGRLRRIDPPGPGRTRRIQALIDSEVAGLLASRDRRGLRVLLRQIWRPNQVASLAPHSERTETSP